MSHSFSFELVGFPVLNERDNLELQTMGVKIQHDLKFFDNEMLSILLFF
jgi:hypothetical protein